MKMKKFAAAVMAAGALSMLAGCSKPDESEVRDKIVEMMTESSVPQDQAEAYADCMAPKLHENVSRSGLNAIVEDGLDAKGDDDDLDAINKAADECQSEITG